MPQLGRTRNRIRSHATYVVATFAAFVVSCHATSATPPTCATKVNGFIGLQNCSPDYILCNHGEETKARCPDPLVFNNHANVCVEAKTCDPQETGSVTNKPTPEPELDDGEQLAPLSPSDFNKTDRALVPIENASDRTPDQYADYIEFFYKAWWWDEDDSICGGVAIFEEWAITAAHCLEYARYDPNWLERRFWSIKDWFYLKAQVKKAGEGILHKIHSVFINEEWYKSNRTVGDIALIRVTTKFDDDHLARIHDGGNAMTFGSCNHAGLHSKIKLGRLYQGGLAKNAVKMQPNAKCLEWNDPQTKEPFFDEDKLLCAKPVNPFSGHLPGDSGSGVYCTMQGGIFLVGLQSYRLIPSSLPDTTTTRIYPEFYTRLSAYRKWIDTTIAKK